MLMHVEKGTSPMSVQATPSSHGSPTPVLGLLLLGGQVTPLWGSLNTDSNPEPQESRSSASGIGSPARTHPWPEQREGRPSTASD